MGVNDHGDKCGTKERWEAARGKEGGDQPQPYHGKEHECLGRPRSFVVARDRGPDVPEPLHVLLKVLLEILRRLDHVSAVLCALGDVARFEEDRVLQIRHRGPFRHLAVRNLPENDNGRREFPPRPDSTRLRKVIERDPVRHQALVLLHFEPIVRRVGLHGFEKGHRPRNLVVPKGVRRKAEELARAAANVRLDVVLDRVPVRVRDKLLRFLKLLEPAVPPVEDLPCLLVLPNPCIPDNTENTMSILQRERGAVATQRAGMCAEHREGVPTPRWRAETRGKRNEEGGQRNNENNEGHGKPSWHILQTTPITLNESRAPLREGPRPSTNRRDPDRGSHVPATARAHPRGVRFWVD